MKKVLSIIVFISILYVLPLLAKPTLMISFPIIFCVVVCIILLASQPLMSAKESYENRSTDKGTMWLIILISTTGQLVSVVDWAYFQSYDGSLSIWVWIGISLAIIGLTLRIWAIQKLQSAFSATVQIKSDQQLITSGPYKWLRHPSYTGAWLVMIGVAIVFNSMGGLLFMGPGMFIVYGKRISTEEKTLKGAFGQEYIVYEKRTKKLIPFIY